MALATAGIADVIPFNLPDLGKIPRFALFDTADVETTTAAVVALNARMAMSMPGLRSSGINVIEIDANGLFDDLLAVPTWCGLTNAATPCFVPLVSLCFPHRAKDLAFFDQSHLNDRVHSSIGTSVVLAARPLPAPVLLLGEGLAGLAAVRHRRAA